MPVTSSVTVSHRLVEVAIHDGFAVSVTVETSAEGVPPFCHTHEITQEEAMPHWMANATPNMPRLEDLTDLIYSILVTRGDLVGVIS